MRTPLKCERPITKFGLRISALLASLLLSQPGFAEGDSGAAKAKSFTQIVSGYYHSCGLSTRGEVWCWGYNAEGQLGDGTVIQLRRTPVRVHFPDDAAS